MVGIGETYLPAFVLAAGMGEVAAGFDHHAALVAGALLQLASPAAIRRLGSNRRWVVCCALIQALAFVPLVAAAWFDWEAGRVAFLMASVYWAAGMATGPGLEHLGRHDRPRRDARGLLRPPHAVQPGGSAHRLPGRRFRLAGGTCLRTCFTYVCRPVPGGGGVPSGLGRVPCGAERTGSAKPGPPRGLMARAARAFARRS